MPNISMCMNDECHLAKECYRHEAKPSEWQSYSYFHPDDAGECYHFMPIWETPKTVAKASKVRREHNE